MVPFSQVSELVCARHCRPGLITCHLDFTHALVHAADLGDLAYQVEVMVLLPLIVIGLKCRHLDCALADYCQVLKRLLGPGSKVSKRLLLARVDFRVGFA